MIKKCSTPAVVRMYIIIVAIIITIIIVIIIINYYHYEMRAEDARRIPPPNAGARAGLCRKSHFEFVSTDRDIISPRVCAW